MNDQDITKICEKYQIEEPVTLSQVIEQLDKLNGGVNGALGEEAKQLWVLHGHLIENSIREIFRPNN